MSCNTKALVNITHLHVLALLFDFLVLNAHGSWAGWLSFLQHNGISMVTTTMQTSHMLWKLYDFTTERTSS